MARILQFRGLAMLLVNIEPVPLKSGTTPDDIKLECVIQPIVFGPIVLDGFRPMSVLKCRSPLLATIITTWAIHEVIADGRERLKHSPPRTLKGLRLAAFSEIAQPPEDDETELDDEDPRALRKTIRRMEIPDFMPADTQDDDDTKIDSETAISGSLTFEAGRHALTLTINTMRVPEALTAKPVPDIVAASVFGALNLLCDHIEEIGNGYDTALRHQCRVELAEIPNIDKLPFMIRNSIGLR